MVFVASSRYNVYYCGWVLDNQYRIVICCKLTTVNMYMVVNFTVWIAFLYTSGIKTSHIKSIVKLLFL